MGNLSNLKKQHDEIADVMTNIENLIKKGGLESTAKDIAFGINAMAGKLKMHLMSEDQYLYPQLMNSTDIHLRTTAESFYAEMGQLAEVFTKFVQEYNVPAKILKDTEKFKIDCKKVFDAVRSRISKEGNKLYPLLEE
jgi:hemerythrin-like domain-containing protein